MTKKTNDKGNDKPSDLERLAKALETYTGQIPSNDAPKDKNKDTPTE